MGWEDITDNRLGEIEETIRNIYLDCIKDGYSHETIYCAVHVALDLGIYKGQVDNVLK